MKNVLDDEIDTITHLNTMREFKFDLFQILPRAKCTVGTLKAEGANVSIQSLGRKKMMARTAREFPSITGRMAKGSN